MIDKVSEKKITYYFGKLISFAPYLMRENGFHACFFIFSDLRHLILVYSGSTSLVILSNFTSFIQQNDGVQNKNVAQPVS